jgi:hypothetical protein
MRYIYIVVLFILISISGCISISNSTMENPDFTQNTPNMTQIPTNYGVYSNYKEKCASQNNLEQLVYIEGDIIISKNKEHEKGISFNVSNNQIQEIEEFYTKSVYSSPDRKYLAYYAHQEDAIKIITVSGEAIGIISIPTGYSTDFYWLAKNLLAVNLHLQGSNQMSIRPIDIYQINPIQKINHFDFDISGINSFMEIDWADLFLNRIMVSPDLSSIIYPAMKPNYPLILSDLDSKKEISSLNQGNYMVYGSLPSWSADGSRFVSIAPPIINNASQGITYVDGTELYSVNINGKITRLTFLTTKYNAGENNYVWSPDNTKIAFLLFKDGYYSMPTIAILDMISNEVTDYCISTNSPLIWSPDGRYIAYNDFSQSEPEVYILDIQELEFMSIYNNGEAYAWILN